MKIKNYLLGLFPLLFLFGISQTHAISFPLLVINQTGGEAKNACAVNLMNGKIVNKESVISGSVINPTIAPKGMGVIMVHLEGIHTGDLVFQYDVFDAKTKAYYGKIKGGYDSNGPHAVPSQYHHIQFTVDQYYVVSCAQTDARQNSN